MSDSRPEPSEIQSFGDRKPQAGSFRSDVGRSITYHMHSLWLFTYSDVKTIIIPKTTFGMIAVLSEQSLPVTTELSTKRTLSSIPLVIIWIWLNLLPLDMRNQCDVGAIIEDKENKPWRPIPAGRMTTDETRWASLAAYAAAVAASFYLGGLTESLLLLVEGCIYNELGGANKGILARNLLNACTWSHTQLQRRRASSWLAILGGVIATTIQFQDLYDQTGDAMRGRRTVPLVAGDAISRLTLIIPMLFWSWACPSFWNLGFAGWALPMTLGIVVAFRLYHYRGVKEDKRSFLLWNFWVISLYLLPVIDKCI